MKSTKPGLLQNQISAVFQFEHTIQCGCETQGFPQINASGRDCATLHYIDN
jgi:Xaa-Pro aminopeptidase